jgi:hypothetical protein
MQLMQVLDRNKSPPPELRRLSIFHVRDPSKVQMSRQRLPFNSGHGKRSPYRAEIETSSAVIC